MVNIVQAEQIVLSNTKDYGTEQLSFDSALGRVLAEDITADRDLPPFNRSTMDGIAIRYASFNKGNRSFVIKATMAAGDAPVTIERENECVEIMTGAALPAATDTVVRYEDISVKDGVATIAIDAIREGQNVHLKGRDKVAGDVVIKAPCVIDATVISMAVSVGKDVLAVKKLPRVVIITTGDELVDVGQQPSLWQIRKSNSYTIKAALTPYGIIANALHITDDLAITKEKIADCLDHYDVIILSGGVSMGKFDHVPQALEEINVTKLFHKVQQRPGKPFWFGKHEQSDTLVFAFPGNPVSGFMCLYRYFLPWLEASLGLSAKPAFYAQLNEDVNFAAPLQYFVQVKLKICRHAHLHATPMEGHGSGDFANLLDTDAFMELPLEQSIFKKGEVYRVWPFKTIL